MSFNAAPNSPSAAIVPGGGWFPDLPVAEFQRLYRLPQEYAAELVEDHLALAALWVQRQLSGWQREQAGMGIERLADIPAAPLLYRRAVYCHAKALLLGQFATVERREAARNEAKESPETAAMFHAWAHDAIADMLNRPRVDVALV